MLLVGDNLDHLRKMPADSIDAIVTDPPYELGFMGKEWDSAGVAYEVERWAEMLRVAKPGAHLIAFAGSRTYHRIACAIEDAGWEIRDQGMWLYGSGFPKSSNIGKQIDARGGGAANFAEFRDHLRARMKETGVRVKDINEALGNRMSSHYLTKGSQPGWPTARDYWILSDLLGIDPSWDKHFPERAKREVVGERDALEIGGGVCINDKGTGPERVKLDITAPATEAAKKWDGWGSALKPAHEPFVIARKPFTGPLFRNVMEHGCGGLNIDACRVGGDSGRWPANVMHDGSEAVKGVFPETKSGKMMPTKTHNDDRLAYGSDGSQGFTTIETYGDSGNASRYFYCAKASKKEREKGLDAVPAMNKGGRRNIHPTVKPIALMRYLVRLICPPDGVVLDPYTGSGSTGVAATLEGFDFIGIELETPHAVIAHERIKNAEDEQCSLKFAQPR